MKKLLLLSALAISTSVDAQNNLLIPDTLSGSTIDLTLQEGQTEFYPGIVTNTMGANGSLLGPTLIMNQGEFVTLNVLNQLQDTTTIHWHGMHVAPEDDGGPHSIIVPGATWSPDFTVLDKAGMYWYHPHLHMRTDYHVSKGIAGVILVRDEEEANLGLPMSYGVDEFPIVLQTKGFDDQGEIAVHTELDTTVLVNGTRDAITDMPAQVVRLRVLNGASQRVMELGFSDDRPFQIIGTDGGLLTAPVEKTRYRIGPGMRVDILVDFSGESGSNVNLMCYGSEIPSAYYGASQPGMGPGATSSLVGYTDNFLNGNDYQLLSINVVDQTVNAITSIPTTLAQYTRIDEADANTSRTLTFTSSGTMGDLSAPFLINGSTFDMGVINYNIPLDNIEIWTLQNNTPIAHPFHIHDVQFFILDINGVAPAEELQGYNDVVLVPGGMGNVRFIAQFSDHADDSIPFMYHCHMLTHEDMGMMGQFLVTDQSSSIKEEIEEELTVYPNPITEGNVSILLPKNSKIENVVCADAQGRQVSIEFQINDGKVDVQGLNVSGVYFVQLIGEEVVKTERVVVK